MAKVPYAHGKKMRFAARRFLEDNFSSPQGLINTLDAYGVDELSLDTVAKWFLRDSVPGRQLPIILAILELDKGEPVSLTAYLVQGA